MVTTAAYTTDSRYRTYPGDGYEGVVRVSLGGFFATGSLLFDGRAILTAAHLFEGRTGSASVTFETRSGIQTLNISKTLIHSSYDKAQSNNDLALVWLTDTAPMDANRYDIYRGSDEIGQSFTMVGYGKTGTESAGATTSGTASPIRLKAENKFDADASTLKIHLGSEMAWTPLAGAQLVADFDDGTSTHDSLGRLISYTDTGRGLNEGLIALERLLALAVSGVALGVGDGLVLAVPKVISHLSFKGTLDQSFSQLLEKPVFSKEVFRFFVIRQQAVYQFVAYGHFSSFENFGSLLPLDRLHKI